MAQRTYEEIDGARSLCEMFQSTVATDSDRTALRSSDGRVSMTWREYGDAVRRCAAGLASLGVGRGDTLGLMMNNRPEFNVTDAAALHLGAIPFSVYPTSSPEQIAYLFSNAGNRVVVCEEEFLPQVTAARRGRAVEHVVCVQAAGGGATMTLEQLMGAGAADFDFDAAWRGIGPSDVATLIFTSGTEGDPKGVELTHRGLLANLSSIFDVVEVGDDRVLSYLPDAHIVNRYLAHYAPMVWGFEVTTVADRRALLAALPEVRPTLFVAVPMLWYRIIGALREGLAERGGIRARVAAWAIGVGRGRIRDRSEGRAPSAWSRLRFAVADRLVLSGLRTRLGLDRAKIALSGAAPIADEAMEFVLGLGLPVCEAWGMSELGALGTLNLPDSVRLGTVGRAVRGVELAVGEHGEVLVRSPGLMRGYRGQPELTAAAVDEDGWLHTGDVGSVDEDGYLRIVDRMKEIIINSGGKNMSPANIENLVRTACPLAGTVVAVGDARPYVVALVALEQEPALAYARKHGLPADPAVLAEDPGILRLVQEGVDRANAKLSRVERIKRFTVVPSFWAPGGDELTPTFKLRRRPVVGKYAQVIDEMYTLPR